MTVHNTNSQLKKCFLKLFSLLIFVLSMTEMNHWWMIHIWHYLILASFYISVISFCYQKANFVLFCLFHWFFFSAHHRNLVEKKIFSYKIMQLYFVMTVIISVSAVNVYMKMHTSISFSIVIINNSSLAADESDFLCKQLYDESSINVLIKNIMIINTVQILNFISSAVHDNRSCQISLTTNQKFKNASV